MKRVAVLLAIVGGCILAGALSWGPNRILWMLLACLMLLTTPGLVAKHYFG